MTNTILILIGLSMIITSVINFAKPAYKSKVGKWATTITIWLSFALGILASFSVAPYLEVTLNTGLLIILGLWLWTGSNLFYDLWELIKGVASRLKEDVLVFTVPGEVEEEIEDKSE